MDIRESETISPGGLASNTIYGMLKVLGVANSNSQLRVLAVGASGPTAGLVLPELSKCGVHLRGFVHKKGDEQTARNLGADEVVVGELNDASALASALEGIDAAFYIAPVELEVEVEVEVGKQFVALAKNAGVRRIVFSSVIHPILSELPNHAGKAPVEEALLDSDLEYVLLHPAVFYQNLQHGWLKVKETGIHGEPWSNETRFSRVDYRDVSEVAAIALTEDRLLYGTFELCADGALNRHEVAALMSEVLGRTVTAKKIDPPSKNGEAKLARMFDWYDRHSLLGNPTTLRAILGREPRTLRAFFDDLNAGR